MSTTEQRMTALERANEVRIGRSEIKRNVRDGVIELDIVLAEPPDVLLGLPAFEVLQWGRRIGASEARKLIRGLITETLPIGRLSDPTRAELVRRAAKKMGRLRVQ